MYFDINRYLYELYGRQTSAYLHPDGGKALWDLYFKAGKAHYLEYIRLRKVVLFPKEEDLFTVDPLLLLPVCVNQRKKPPINEKDLHYLEENIGKELDPDEYLHFMKILVSTSLPEEKITKLLDSQLSLKNCARDRRPYQSKASCQKNLLAVFPDCEEIIREHTIQAMNVYFSIMEINYKATCGLIRKRSEANFPAFFGMEIPLLLICPVPGVSKKDCVFGKTVYELSEYAMDNLNRKLPDLNDPEIRPFEFWTLTIYAVYDRKTNGKLFSYQASLLNLSKEEEPSFFLEELYSRSKLLKDECHKHKDMLLDLYLKEKVKLPHRLLKRLSQSPEHRVIVSRKELLLLFMNLYPVSENGSRSFMDRKTRNRLFFYAEKESVSRDFCQFIELLNLSRERCFLPDDLIQWTEMYFEKRKEIRNEL